MITVVVNALVAGIIAGCGVVIAGMANAGSAAWPSNATWLVAGLTGLISACKDWQSHMTVPPQ